MHSWFVEYSLYILLFLSAVFTFIWLWLFRKRLSARTWALLIISILHVIYGVFCVKTFAILETLDLSKFSNMSLFGAVFFMPIAYYVGAKMFKRKTSDVFDIFTVCMVFTLFCARINCLISGCCQGRIVSMHSDFRWPTREAELVYYIVFLAIVIPAVLKKDTKGLIYPVYMISYGVFRTVCECFRESDTNGIFHVSHIWAVLALIIGLSFYVEIKKRCRVKKPIG